MTLYGYADNSPPGTDDRPSLPSAGTARPVGWGPYTDPVTFATDVEELGWCQIIYVPYMKRYFIHEDECSQCDTDWSTRTSTASTCGREGTPGRDVSRRRVPSTPVRAPGQRADSVTDPDDPTIMIDPPVGLPVTTAPIFSAPSTCWTPISVTNPGKQSSALETTVGLHIHAVDASPTETLAYHGAGLPSGLDDQSPPRA